MGEADYTLEDLHEEWSEPGFELARDAVVVEDADGTADRLRALPRRRPAGGRGPEREGEGAGTALLEWAERRGRERGRASCARASATVARALARCWRPHGWSRRAQLLAARARRRRRRRGAARPARRCAPATPPRLYAIHEAAFAATRDYTPRTEEAWTQREFGAHNLDAALARRRADGEPVGFALVRRWEDDIAYVALLAVHPDAAGRGLGGALLTGVFAAAARAGYRQVELNVASDNPNACGSTSASA